MLTLLVGITNAQSGNECDEAFWPGAVVHACDSGTDDCFDLNQPRGNTFWMHSSKRLDIYINDEMTT